MNWFKRAMAIVTGREAAPAPPTEKQRAAELLVHRFRALDSLQPGLGTRAVACFVNPTEAEWRSVVVDLDRLVGKAYEVLRPDREFREVVLARPVLAPFQYVLLGLFLNHASSFRACGPGGMHWFLEILLAIGDDPKDYAGWRAEDLAALLPAGKAPPEGLVEIVVHPDLHLTFRPHLRFQRVAGIGEHVAAHPGPVTRWLREGSPDELKWLPSTLLELGVPMDGFREEVLELVLGTRKDLRMRFEPLLDRLDPAWLRSTLESRATRPADERARVAGLLWTHYGEEVRGFLEQWRDREKTSRIRELLAELLAGPAPPAAVSPPVETAVDGPLGPGAREELRRFLQECDARQEEQPEHGRRLGDEGFRELVAGIEGASEIPTWRSAYWLLYHLLPKRDSLLGHPELLPAHLVRLVCAIGNHARYRKCADLSHEELEFLGSTLARRPDFELTLLAQALGAAGLDPDLPLEMLLHWGPGYLGRVPPERIAGYLADRAPRLGPALQGKYPGSEAWQRQRIQLNALWALSLLETVPPSLNRQVFELGLLGQEPQRSTARGLARHFADLEERLVRELSAATQARRSGAATWLSEIGATSALEPLRVAARKETNEVARAAMLGAVEGLGGSVDEFVSRDALRKEAEAGLPGRLPPDLDWAANLPVPHWREDGQPLERESLHWLLVRAHQLKSPGPDPLLARYAGMLAGRDAERFASLLLKGWIEAAEDPHVPAPSRGLLALVAVFAGPEVVPPVAEFMVCWYGQKAAQCKALLEMLAWMDHGEATQLLLGVADRFQTRGIQEAARHFAHELAHRRGWTPDQLGDRTCPTAGFSAEGRLRLDFGARWFEARLDDRLEIRLFDQDGRSLKALPKARQDDDAALAAAARKALAQARKSLKEVVAGQSARLASAMALGRSWSAEEWSSILLPHPILGRLAVRVLWRVLRPDGSRLVVRPLEDGSLTSIEDEEVDFAPEDRLDLVHETLLTPEESAAWIRHLEEYRVDTLFPQLGRHRVEPAPGQILLDDFRGHMVGTLTLRSRANRLGFGRGPVGEDGGAWYYEYRREYAELGLRADLRFSGSVVPEEADAVAALHGLAFRRLEGLEEVALQEIPAPLLSESWHQLEGIAASGKGFDPEWEDKVDTGW